MKTEVLRLEHIFEPPYLSDFSMDIYASEIVGLVTIDYIGLNYLFDILQNNASIKYGRVFYNGKLVNNQNNTHKKDNKIILISEKKLLIDNLSVAENLFVIRSGYKKKYVNIKLLRLQTRKVFEELGVFIVPSLYVQSLSIYEKTVLEITKAFVSGANLVLLDNISTFLTEEEVNKIMSLAKKLMQEKKMSFVFICNHHQESFYFCGRCFLKKKGKIIKCLDVEQKKNFDIEKYSYEFINWVRNSKHENLYKSNLEQNKGGFSFKTKDFFFSIKKGEAIVLLDSDSRLINQLFTMMNNIKDFPDAEFMVEGKRINKNNSKIMIIPSNPTEKLLFPQLSVIDNICFNAALIAPTEFIYSSEPTKSLLKSMDVERLFFFQMSKSIRSHRLQNSDKTKEFIQMVARTEQIDLNKLEYSYCCLSLTLAIGQNKIIQTLLSKKN